MKHYTLQINARLRPLDRGDLYEDPIGELLEEQEIGSVDGGGTMMAANGEVEFCDVEIDLEDSIPQERLLAALGQFALPKGSVLRSETEESPIGELEGLAIYLNGTELPDEVYQTCDINYVVSHLEELMGKKGRFFSHWQGPQDTALYYYGPSFDHMKQAIAEFVAQYPLCQKCRIEQIA